MPVSISTRSAHDATNPRERIPDITATGVNTIPVSTDIEVQSDVANTLKAGAISSNSISEQKLSTVLPPLVFGTATFNYQFNKDPYALQPNEIVSAALLSGIRAFDTSPYYGPAELILGEALHSPLITQSPTLQSLKREDYFLLTKTGRIASDVFDYSPSWIRHSVKRSLRRLKTTYLDVVYLHDVEFVSPAEVISGIQTLRNIRDTDHTIKYIGICGYPVETLCSLAELVLQETGSPLDIVQSYANFTIQNQTLLTQGLTRLQNAGVEVLTNASPLGMGLCRSQGPPIGALGNWHPAPDPLRAACLEAARYVEETHSERLETIAIRFAMENWLAAGSALGSQGILPAEAITALHNPSSAPKLSSNNSSSNASISCSPSSSGSDSVTTHGEQASHQPIPPAPALAPSSSSRPSSRPKLGISVMGVSKLSELDETMAVYESILASSSSSSTPADPRQTHVNAITAHIRTQILGAEFADFAWSSPEPGFVNRRKVFGVGEDDIVADRIEATGAK